MNTTEMNKAILLFTLFLAPLFSMASVVEVVETDAGFQLLKDGEPYYINGAGGTVELDKLSEYGGNSIRTWGVDANTDAVLDAALEHGLTVTFGIWMGQERQGFDYNNEGAVKAQLEMFRQTIRKYKDHPAILLWGVGNEMDLDYSNFEVWKHLEAICQMVKEEDPNHPTMAVTAGLDVAEVKLINKHTPSLDILGLNTYGNIAYLPEAVKVYGWNKAYVVAEWGPYGWWEVAKTEWGASIEETSSQKAETYKKSFEAILGDKENCLGSYVFLWGQKQEHTSTWFSLFTEEGDETEVMDALIKGWRGTDPDNFAPTISDFELNGQLPKDNVKVKMGEEVTVSVEIKDKDQDKIRYQWQLIPESTDKKTGGDKERAPKPVSGVFKKADMAKGQVTFNAPYKPGQYRIYLFAHDGNDNVATGNFPFLIEEVN